jgi:hypothetical protein
VWFDRQMDRVTGSYEPWAKRWVIIIAIVVVCACNVDSIAVARALYGSGAVRAAVVRQAQDGAWGWPLKTLGLLISVGAAALGARFWYRLLDRIGTLRNTGRPPTPGS